MHKTINILDKILQVIVIGAVAAPLIFSKYFYYPFISGKVLYFRILVFAGILVFAAIILIKKEIRFRMNKIWLFFLFYVLMMFISAIFGLNFIRSFWSNIERAEGVVFWLFLFVYLSLLIYTLREAKLWKWFFRISLITGMLVIVYGLLQHFALIAAVSTTGSRISSTLGNPAYLGSYALMHFFIGLYLIVKDKQLGWKIFYGISLIFNFWAIFLTQTRGAAIGLLTGLLVLGILSVLRGKNRKIKQVGAIGLITIIILSLGVYLLRNTSLIQSNATLRRVTSINLQSYTVRTRLAAWQTSLEAFKERPILGWGPENYGYAFSKYFPPEIYVNSGSRIWFDKAHNVFFENLVTNGILGIMLYFAIIFSAIYYLWHSKKFSVITSNIFIALLMAHLVANMFVFDSVSTYILWAAVLGFIASVSGEQKEYKLNIGWQAALGAVAIMFLYISYVTNVSAMVDNKNLLYAEAYKRDGQVQEAYNFYLKALENNNSFTRFEIARELAVFVRNSAGSLPNYEAGPMFNKAIKEIEKSIEMDPNEIRHYYNLSQLYLKSYKLNVSRLEKIIDMKPKMLELAPKRAHTYYQIGEAHVLKKEYDKALENFQQAVELNSDIIDPYVNVYAVAVLKGDKELEQATALKMEKLSPAYFDKEETLLRYVPLYKKAGLDDRFVQSLEKLISLRPDKIEYISTLAIYYAERGQDNKAEKTIKTLLGRNAELDRKVEEFVKKIYMGEFRKQ